ncbi:MAG: 30S ribosomal protein S11 [Alphaproteobacteria bacterium]|nr:30S ribosomal protein S11 [Alphaproteobacteria bacterium]
MAVKAAKATKKKIVRTKVGHAIAHVLATFNNTRITLTDMSGQVLCWGTSGAAGFKSAKKSTPYAATIVAESLAKKAADMGVKTVDVLMRGPGNGREAAVRGLGNAGITVNSITDTTRVPHNGCRAKKVRRV